MMTRSSTGPTRRVTLHLAVGIALCGAGALVGPGAVGAQVRVTGSAPPGAHPAVYGAVHDSLSGRPLARAVVQLAPADNPAAGAHDARTDTLGVFRIPNLPPGRYLITFEHPRLDSLGFAAPTRAFEVPDGVAEVGVDLAIPSARTIVTALCGARNDTTGALIGRVVDPVSPEAMHACMLT